jgi:YesN/AraC family two-component response regulator
VRYFIRECAHEAFSRLGTAAVCLEDRLVTVADVYVLTGHAEFDYAQKAMEHGVTAYLLKPLSKVKLQEVYIASYEKHRHRLESQQVSVIRERALLESFTRRNSTQVFVQETV